MAGPSRHSDISFYCPMWLIQSILQLVLLARLKSLLELTVSKVKLLLAHRGAVKSIVYVPMEDNACHVWTGDDYGIIVVWTKVRYLWREILKKKKKKKPDPLSQDFTELKKLRLSQPVGCMHRVESKKLMVPILSTCCQSDMHYLCVDVLKRYRFGVGRH